MTGVWREPAEESTEMYPGLVVHDGRQVGAITIGASRLPLSCASHYLANGWQDFVDDYGPDNDPLTINGFTEVDVRGFLHNLFGHRGEFARLLLVLADVERVEGERSDCHFAEHAPGQSIIQMDIGEGGVPFPDSWWEVADERDRVADQLRRCLSVLEAA